MIVVGVRRYVELQVACFLAVLAMIFWVALSFVLLAG